MNNLEFDMPKEKSAIIKVIGVGGAGTNALNHMFQKGIKGVNFIVANTDDQHLNLSPVKTKLTLGPQLTSGQGTGADPEVGRKATEESMASIKEELGHGTKMLFIAAGMGKGTGTGGSPVIAKIAREMGILTVAIVTTPLMIQGKTPLKNAEEGIERLKENVDALIVISNDKIREIYGALKLSEAFAMADDVLTNAVKGIAEIITGAGIQNTDFKDVNNVLKDGGMTIMGIGHAAGESRAVDAVNNALKSPLLNDVDIVGAQKALINITYSSQNECSYDEMVTIVEMVNQAAQNDIEIIYGTSVDDTLEDELAVTIVVTGFNTEKNIAKVAAKQEVISLDEQSVNSTSHIDSKNDYIILENEKQIVIDFNMPENQESELFARQEFSNLGLEFAAVEEDEIVQIKEVDDVTSFIDSNGRMLEETEEDKRKRFLSELSFDVTSPLNSSNHAVFGLDPLSVKSNTLITDNLHLFKDNNKYDTNLD